MNPDFSQGNKVRKVWETSKSSFHKDFDDFQSCFSSKQSVFKLHQSGGLQIMDSMKYESPRVNMGIFDLAKLYKGPKSEASEMNQSLRDGFDEGEILDVIEEPDVIEAAATGILGASISFAIYKALKEFLSLEGARRRGEIKNSEVIERVSQTAWEAGKKGVAIGTILGVVIMIFGSSILIPLAIISPFVSIQMTVNLWQAFWKGLDDNQKQDLKSMANQLGGKIKNFFAELDKPEKNVLGEDGIAHDYWN